MSVCSGLDQIEDFLLSSSNNFINNSSSGVSAASANRIMGPPFPMGNLNGLNLSLNHGLDLTCPNYGCLNLTQSSAASNQQQQQQQPRGGGLPGQQGGLNLTSSSQINSHGNNNKKEASEVGLNLSLQNGKSFKALLLISVI